MDLFNIDGKLLRLDTSFDGIPLALYIINDENKILLDTGCSYMADTVILPFLVSKDIEVKSIGSIINSHAHFDHIGGNSRIQKESGATINASSKAALWIEDHKRAFREYHLYADSLPFKEGYRQTIMDWMGDEVKVDRVLGHGQAVKTGSLDFEVIPAKGHSDGGIMLFEKEHGILVSGDALQGSGFKSEAGRTSPEYRDLKGYLDTLDKASKLNPETILPSHFPPMQSAAAKDFLSQCCTSVDELRESVRTSANNEKRNLYTLTQKVSERTGYDFNYELLTSVDSHIKELGIILEE